MSTDLTYLQEPVANEFFDVDQETFLEKFNSLKKHKDATIVFNNFGIDFYVKTNQDSYKSYYDLTESEKLTHVKNKSRFIKAEKDSFEKSK